MTLARRASSILRSINRLIPATLSFVFGAWALVLLLQATVQSQFFDGWPAVFVLAFGAFFGWLPAVFVHELGHALAAGAVGWRVWVFNVGPFSLRLRPKPHIIIDGAERYDAGGYVLATPKNERAYSRWRNIAFSAGGPIASLGAVLLLYPLALSLSGGNDAETFVAGIMVAFCATSLACAALTVWPFVGKVGHPNDAMQIVLWLRRWVALPRASLHFGDILEARGFKPEEFDPWIQDSMAGRRKARTETFTAFLDAVEKEQFTEARALISDNTDESLNIMRAYLSLYADSDAARAETILATAGAWHTEWREGMALRDLTIVGILSAAGEAGDATIRLDRLAERNHVIPHWTTLVQRARARIAAATA